MEEIIKSITAAETKATEMKAQAQAKAAQILADAQTQANRTEESSAQVCKAYVETQLKTARAEAERRFADSIERQSQQSHSYAAETLAKSDSLVVEIVGRVTSGNR